MSLPEILRTKLFTPPVQSHFVWRPRISEELESAVRHHHALTLVAAPAGFGKSTAVSSWIHGSDRRAAWLSLDESDNELALFWTYIIAAFQTVQPEIAREILPSLSQPTPPPVETILTALINELVDLDASTILILDDYHTIENESVHEGIRFFLDHIPPKLHLVIATRADPPLPLAQLRAKNTLTELREADLRFTREESEMFLNEIMGLELTAEDIRLLGVRTEVWIVGLVLAAQSLKGFDDKHEFITAFSGSHHFILEYLLEEVLSRQSEARRAFLLQTSILERLNASLCDAVIDGSNSSEMLDDLRKDHVFLIPLDRERRWFRYHHLFTDLLQSYLVRGYAEDQIRALHRHASKWFENASEPNRAINYALSGHDFGRAVSLIEEMIDLLISQGHLTTLLRWTRALPDEVLLSHPRLCLYQAWALSLGGQSIQAGRILADTKSILETLPDTKEHRALRGELSALLAGIMTYTNEPQRIIQEAQEALSYLPKENLVSQARVQIAMGTGYAYGDDIGKAKKCYLRAKDLALEAHNPFLAAAAIEMLAGMQIYHHGRLRDAAEILGQVIELGRKNGDVCHPFTGTAHILLAEINIEWNELDIANRYLERGRILLQQGGISYSLTYLHGVSARLALARGETDKVVEALHASKRAAQASPLMHILIHNLSRQVKYWLQLGDIATATQWAKGDPTLLGGGVPANLPHYLREVHQISLARVYHAQGELNLTIETLNNGLTSAEKAGRMGHVLEICLLKALALFEQGESVEALNSLEYTLSLAEPVRFTRIFLEAGKPARNILQFASKQGVHIQYASKILAAFDRERERDEADTATLSEQGGLIDALTVRELDVLRLVCEGYSNQQIASDLTVSINTVKKHTSNIYSKLGVRNRPQAALQARELGLV